MRLHVIWPGKTKNVHLRALIEDYQERVSHFSRCDITELRETRSRENDAGIDKQSKRITDALLNADVTVLLDPLGQEWSSEQLARQVQNWENSGLRTVAFVIGGPDGVSPEVKKQVNKLWSLSKLTLTHEMARVVLLEQLYRAFAIIHRLPYVR
jgi:23S rRNA (pseudouridine1915-N3)-methyltransferase